MKIAALAGGVGGAKFLLGLSRVMDTRDLTIIANTGDDIVLHGLRISPDPDIITYTLAGVVNPETGWGFRDETFRVLEQLKSMGAPDWFRLGDKDLGVHLRRTALLAGGASLSECAELLSISLGVAAKILPMSDETVTTMLDTEEGKLHLQEYLVKRRAEPKLRGISFEGIEAARPAPGVLEALREAHVIIICPSNPLISIGPILAVAGIREALAARKSCAAAISPLVAGRSLKGPSDKMMAELRMEVCARAVAEMYRDICGLFVLDAVDADARSDIEGLGMDVLVTDTVMRSDADKERLARDVLAAMERRCAPS
jgi:LPPG:FO 2-phospho-L-lactate transferase